jgi:DNA invertase Pin-like site-specific DNA recombinase
MKDDIEIGLVKHLWVYDRSRFFRDDTDSSIFRKDYLDKFGVQFYEGELGNLVNFDSLEEKLSYDIISKLQQYENEKRSHKSKQGKRHLLRQGLDNRWYGGSVFFRYKSENGILSIYEEQSKWVVWMFSAVLDGVSSIDTKGELDRNGVTPPRTKSGLWNLGTINKILRNRSYVGEKIFYDKELGETFSY